MESAAAQLWQLCAAVGGESTRVGPSIRGRSKAGVHLAVGMSDMAAARHSRLATVTTALLVTLALAGPARSATVTEATGEQALDARLELAFAPGAGSRTVVRGVVTLPPSQASRNRHGFYNLALAGEVLVQPPLDQPSTGG
jgi:hypothetical protein